MKKYSSKRAQKGKIAYRVPSKFRYQQRQKIKKRKAEEKNGKVAFLRYL